jgi:hypothetical protein
MTLDNATYLNVSGVYFFSGGLTLTGKGSLQTNPGISATIIVIPIPSTKQNPQPSLKMAGGSSLNITAPTTAPSTSDVPSQLQSVDLRNLLTQVALFDPETSPQTTGTSTMSGSGVFYLPNADPLNFQGTSNAVVSTCTEVIAKSILLSGTPSFDNSGCSQSVIPKSRFVVLVK